MKIEWKTCVRVGVSAFALFLAIRYWETAAGLAGLALGAAMPLAVGAFVAYIIDLPMSFFERTLFPAGSKGERAKRPVSLALALLAVAAAVALLLWIVLPELGRCAELLLARVPPTLERLTQMLADSQLFSQFQLTDLVPEVNWRELIAQVGDALLHGFGSVADAAVGLVTRVVSTTVNGFIALIFAVYLLLAKEQLARQVRMVARRYCPAAWRRRCAHVLRVLNDCFRRYFVGQCTEAVILGVLCALGMALFRFPYAGVVGVTVGFTALIPVAGAYIGGAVGFLLILTESPVRAFLFLLYLVILQQLENNLIYPKVVGTSIGLPGIWVLAAVIVGGGVSGIVGMVLAVPLTAAAYKLLKEDVQRTPGRQGPGGL